MSSVGGTLAASDQPNSFTMRSFLYFELLELASVLPVAPQCEIIRGDEPCTAGRRIGVGQRLCRGTTS